MNSELKKEYVMRISHANNVQMIIISYEIIETYLDEAYEATAQKAFVENVDMAKRCIDEMMNNLHYEYDLAKTLKELYLYMKRRLRKSVWENDKEIIAEVKKIIISLRNSYKSIEEVDKSESLMKNTQSVMTGITYGRNQILDELSQDVSNRGYRV